MDVDALRAARRHGDEERKGTELSFLQRRRGLLDARLVRLVIVVPGSGLAVRNRAETYLGRERITAERAHGLEQRLCAQPDSLLRYDGGVGGQRAGEPGRRDVELQSLHYVDAAGEDRGGGIGRVDELVARLRPELRAGTAQRRLAGSQRVDPRIELRVELVLLRDPQAGVGRVGKVVHFVRRLDHLRAAGGRRIERDQPAAAGRALVALGHELAALQGSAVGIDEVVIRQAHGYRHQPRAELDVGEAQSVLRGDGEVDRPVGPGYRARGGRGQGLRRAERARRKAVNGARPRVGDVESVAARGEALDARKRRACDERRRRAAARRHAPEGVVDAVGEEDRAAGDRDVVRPYGEVGRLEQRGERAAARRDGHDFRSDRPARAGATLVGDVDHAAAHRYAVQVLGGKEAAVARPERDDAAAVEVHADYAAAYLVDRVEPRTVRGDAAAVDDRLPGGEAGVDLDRQAAGGGPSEDRGRVRVAGRIGPEKVAAGLRDADDAAGRGGGIKRARRAAGDRHREDIVAAAD